MKELFEKWATEFLNSPSEPMSDEITQVFLAGSMAESSDQPIPDEMKEEFLYKVIDKRAAFVGLKLSDWAKVFIMFLTKSPGSAVMYIYALRSLNIEINISEIANKFPMGFLSETRMSEMWDAQKGHILGIKDMDNMLDHYSFQDS